jgi:hypothetical protein
MWHAWKREEVFTGFWLGGPKERDHWEYLGHMWEDNIMVDLREIGINRVNWIWLTQDRVWWQAFVSTVMNLQVP